MFSVRMLLFFALVLSVGIAPAFAEQRSQTRVIVAEDKTEESGCKVSINNGPEEECSPGSVIWTRTITYDEAMKLGLKDYVLASENSTDNEKLGATLANKISRRNHDMSNLKPAPNACLSQNDRTVNSSFTFSTGWRVSYILKYNTWSNCEVRGIRDTAKTDGTTGIRWHSTCTDAESQVNQRCNSWGASLNGTYLPEKQEINSFVFRQWRMTAVTSLHSAYAYWYFD
jgi:hypothetical protein